LPQPVSAVGEEELAKPVEVAAGDHHSLLLLEDGTVWAWGSNSNGQLGIGNKVRQIIPVKIDGLTDIINISAFEEFSLALKSDGTVWAWGLNDFGQLGIGNMTNQLTPANVKGLTDVTAISAGRQHSLALKSDGTVWAWGRNIDGELGVSGTSNRLTPININLSNIVAISAGYNYSLALRSNGDVLGWGHNNLNQLGLGGGSPTRWVPPTKSPGLTDVTAISAGFRQHSLAAKSDGTAWACGSNNRGQVGVGNTIDQAYFVKSINLTDITDISAGYGHSLALKSDGTIWAYGENGYGQLGASNNNDRSTAVKVINLTDVTAISAGKWHSLALKSDGSVWSWGVNWNGQLGTGDTNNYSAPFMIWGPTSSTDPTGPFMPDNQVHELAIDEHESVINEFAKTITFTVPESALYKNKLVGEITNLEADTKTITIFSTQGTYLNFKVGGFIGVSNGDKVYATDDTRYTIVIDKVVDKVVTKINDRDSRILYSGNWLEDNNAPLFYMGDQKVTAQTGASAEFTFSGTRISIIGATSWNLGMMDVYVDGAFVERVDLYSQDLQPQMVLFTASNLSGGQHTIQIVCSGDKNVESTDYYITLDAIEFE